MLTWALLSALPIYAGSAPQQRRQGTLFGSAVCSIADLDGDGVRDIAVGDPSAADGSGEVSIYSGRTGRLVALLVSDGGDVAFGQTIESTTTPTGTVRWAVAAAGGGSRRPYVDVFEGRRLLPVMRLEAPELEHVFGHRIAFWHEEAASPAVLALVSVHGGRNYDGTEGTWKVRAWSVPDGVELWQRSAGSWNRDRSPWLWAGLPRRSRGPASILVAGALDDESGLDLAQLDPRTGELISESNPTIDREGPSRLAFLHVDGDEAPDLLLGYPSEYGEAPGTATLVSGATSTVIRRHTGEHQGWGASVAALGDLDCDGIGEYGIASFGLMEPGIVSVHSGADGTVLHSWTGDSKRIGYQHFGRVLCGADDLDGDGVSDVVIGSTNPFAPHEGGSVWAFSGRGGDLLWSVER